MYQAAPVASTEKHNEKFNRIVRQLGDNAAGTIRHQLEVDFAHALNEIHGAPAYVVPKLMERLSNLITQAAGALKTHQEAKTLVRR